MHNAVIINFRSSYDNVVNLNKKKRQKQDRSNIRYLQLLRAIIHNQVKLVDPKLKEEGQDPERYRMLDNIYVILHTYM